MPSEGVSINNVTQIAAANIDGDEIIPVSSDSLARGITVGALTSYLGPQLYSTVKGEVNIDAVAGTTYTIVTTDKGRVKRFTNANPVTVTIDATIPTGEVFHILQWGTGQVSIVTAGGANLRTTEGTATRERYSTVTLYKIDSTDWLLYGDTTLS